MEGEERIEWKDRNISKGNNEKGEKKKNEFEEA
jgi:hypothetical protein